MGTPDQSGQEAQGAAVADLTPEQEARINELDSLKNDGAIDEDQYNAAKEKIVASQPLVDPSAPPGAWGNALSNLPPGPTEAELAAANAAQGQGPGDTPEVRPQGFQTGVTGQQTSKASQRLDKPVSPTPEEYAAANSEENKRKATEDGFQPNLEVGQRVTLVGDHSEAGRMAYVSRIIYKDPIQEMIAAAGTPARSNAEVLQYVVITRDGRSDTLIATPKEVKPIEENQGWGRGQI